MEILYERVDKNALLLPSLYSHHNIHIGGKGLLKFLSHVIEMLPAEEGQLDLVADYYLLEGVRPQVVQLARWQPIRSSNILDYM